MNETIGIFHFSGTGNTELVAYMIAQEFENHGCRVELTRIEDVVKNNTTPNMDQYDKVGIGSPVIGFGAPGIIHNFIKIIPSAGPEKKMFIFRTAGGVGSINYRASKHMIRKLTQKGYAVFHERIFSIGSNWVVKFEDRVMKKLYEATCRKIKIMCDEVLKGKSRIYKTNWFLTLIMDSIIFISHYLERFIGLSLYTTRFCNRCGKCIKNCPTRNIYEKKGKIRFKLSCTCCMRCVYNCPRNAINYKLLSFFIVPGGYNIKEIIENPVVYTNYIQDKTPSFFQNYIQNDER